MARRSSPAVTLYPFPLKLSESLYFASSRAAVDKAVLSANGVTLSIVTFDPSQPQAAEHPLDFFGDKPIHGALASQWDVKVTLYVSDGNTPSLLFIPADTSITWEDHPSGVFYDDVVAGSNDGPVKRTMVYMREIGGFKRED